MHTQLKGRIFSAQGVSYLVLQEQDGCPDTLRVKALTRQRAVRRMRAEEIHRYLTPPGRG